MIKNLQGYRKLNRTKLKKAARNILTQLERPSAELSILFVGNRKMKQLNTLFRGIRKSTDVLSFDANVPGLNSTCRSRRGSHSPVLGDVVINIPKALSHARLTGSGFYNEIYRLLIHGVLHLLGYGHEKSRKRASAMKKKEREILNAVKKMG